jgi:hypothetical protein
MSQYVVSNVVRDNNLMNFRNFYKGIWSCRGGDYEENYPLGRMLCSLVDKKFTGVSEEFPASISVSKDNSNNVNNAARRAMFLMLPFLVHSSTLKMEAVGSSETLVSFYHNIRRYVSNDSTLRYFCCVCCIVVCCQPFPFAFMSPRSSKFQFVKERNACSFCPKWSGHLLRTARAPCAHNVGSKHVTNTNFLNTYFLRLKWRNVSLKLAGTRL